MKFIKHIIEITFLRIMIFLMSFMPYRMGQRFSGAFFGGIIQMIGFSMKKKMMKRLQESFPEKSHEELHRIQNVTIGYLGRLVYEFVFFNTSRDEDLWKRVTIEESTLEALKKARDEKKGIILVAAHFGNWEVLNRALIRQLETPFHVFAAPMTNPYGTEYIFRTREKTGMKNLLPTINGIAVVRLLKRGEMLGIVADQNARTNGVFIPFLNRPASTFLGPATFAYHSGAPCFFIAGVRQPDESFRIEAIPLGSIDKEKNPDMDGAMVEFTLRWVDILEKYIQKYPEQYFWFHNRWKTKPGPTDTIYDRVETDLRPL